MSQTTPLQVAVGILQNPAGQVLVSRRPAGREHAGAWEFPGGKIAAGELPVRGLMRELREELGIVVQLVRHFARYTHRYPAQDVELYVWRVLQWQGEPRGIEGQTLDWLLPDALLPAGLLPADAPLVRLLEAAVPVNELDCEPALLDMATRAAGWPGSHN